MNTYRSLTLLLLFCTFLITGVVIGRSVGANVKSSGVADLRQQLKQPSMANKAFNEESSLEDQPEEDSPSRPVGNRQRNLLIVGVDDLGNPSPRLMSVWLVIYLNDSPHMMLLPIYPTTGTRLDGNSSFEPLDRKFRLTSQRSLDPEFVEELTERDFWWTSQITVDQHALTDLVDFVAGASGNSSLDGVNAITSIPPPWENPKSSLFGQADLIKMLCQNSTGLSTVPRWQYLHLFAMTQDHFSTAFEANEAVEEWLNLLSLAGGVSCEFPSMALTSLHP